MWLVAAGVAALVGTAPADAFAVTKKFGAQADAHVTAAKRHANFGRASTLLVDAKPTTIAYLRFNVAVTGTITNASLSLYPRTGSVAGVTVRRARSKTWGERTITYANRPGIVATPVASSKRLWGGKRRTIDVTSLVTKSGIVTFALRTSATSAVKLASREAASTLRPRLTVATNSAPVCDDVELEIPEDAAGEVAANCSDADGDALAYDVVTEPSHGTAVVTPDGKLRYEPDGDWNGVDGYTYTASDGRATSDPPVNVFVDVAPVNDARLCKGVSLVVAEDAPDPGQVAASCSDADGDTLTYEIATQGVKGAASVVSGELSYDSNANENGSDSFTYRASDGTLSSGTATVDVTITAVNDEPRCFDLDLTLDEDDGIAEQACTDADGDVLQFDVTGGPAHGDVDMWEGGGFDYYPDPDYFGADEFQIVATDESLATSGHPKTVTLTVAPLPDAPACDDVEIATDEDAPGEVAPNCSDADGDALAYDVVTEPSHGTRSSHPTGSSATSPTATGTASTGSPTPPPTEPRRVTRR